MGKLMIMFSLIDKSIPINGLSPVPRDQCASGAANPGAMDLHPMYSSFRTGPPPPPPPQAQIPPNGKSSRICSGVSWVLVSNREVPTNVKTK